MKQELPDFSIGRPEEQLQEYSRTPALPGAESALSTTRSKPQPQAMTLPGRARDQAADHQHAALGQ
jgi:hypothetical protein